MHQGFEDTVYDVGEYNQIPATYVHGRRLLNDVRLARGYFQVAAVMNGSATRSPSKPSVKFGGKRVAATRPKAVDVAI